MLHERLQDLGSRSPAAGVGRGCHPADSPITELVALVDAERDRFARLMLGELVDGHVRAQHVTPERAGLGEGDQPEVERRHVHTA
jgi:hypothetical protein